MNNKNILPQFKLSSEESNTSCSSLISSDQNNIESDDRFVHLKETKTHLFCLIPSDNDSNKNPSRAPQLIRIKISKRRPQSKHLRRNKVLDCSNLPDSISNLQVIVSSNRTSTKNDLKMSSRNLLSNRTKTDHPSFVVLPDNKERADVNVNITGNQSTSDNSNETYVIRSKEENKLLANRASQTSFRRGVASFRSDPVCPISKSKFRMAAESSSSPRSMEIKSEDYCECAKNDERRQIGNLNHPSKNDNIALPKEPSLVQAINRKPEELFRIKFIEPTQFNASSRLKAGQDREDKNYKIPRCTCRKITRIFPPSGGGTCRDHSQSNYSGRTSNECSKRNNNEIVKINYNLVRRCLKHSSADEKCEVLDAIRVRIKSKTLNVAAQTIEDIQKFDLFGVQCECRSRPILKDLFWPMTERIPHPLQTSIARLINAIVSYETGRDYFNNRSIIHLLTWGDLGRDNIDEEMADNLMAVMMKLSKNRFHCNDMIKKGLLTWLLNHMELAEYSSSKYHLECMTRLLRILMRIENSIDLSMTEIRDWIVMLGRYLDSENTNVRRNILASLLALFQRNGAISGANEMNFAQIINKHIEMSSNSNEKKHLKILNQLLTGKSNLTRTRKSAIRSAEEELDFEDETESEGSEIDYHPGEKLLREKFCVDKDEQSSSRSKKQNFSFEIKKPTCNLPNDDNLASRVFIEHLHCQLPKIDQNRIFPMFNYRTVDTPRSCVHINDTAPLRSPYVSGTTRTLKFHDRLSRQRRQVTNINEQHTVVKQSPKKFEDELTGEQRTHQQLPTKASSTLQDSKNHLRLSSEATTKYERTLNNEVTGSPVEEANMLTDKVVSVHKSDQQLSAIKLAVECPKYQELTTHETNMLKDGARNIDHQLAAENEESIKSAKLQELSHRDQESTFGERESLGEVDLAHISDQQLSIELSEWQDESTASTSTIQVQLSARDPTTLNDEIPQSEKSEKASEKLNVELTVDVEPAKYQELSIRKTDTLEDNVSAETTDKQTNESTVKHLKQQLPAEGSKVQKYHVVGRLTSAEESNQLEERELSTVEPGTLEDDVLESDTRFSVRAKDTSKDELKLFTDERETLKGKIAKSALNVAIEKLPFGKSIHDDIKESSIGLIIDQLLKDVKENAKPSDQQVSGLSKNDKELSAESIAKLEGEAVFRRDDSATDHTGSQPLEIYAVELNEEVLPSNKIDEYLKEELIVSSETDEQAYAVRSKVRKEKAGVRSDEETQVTVKSDQQLLTGSVQILNDKANDNRGSQRSGILLSSLSLHLEDQAISTTESNKQSSSISAQKSEDQAVTKVKNDSIVTPSDQVVEVSLIAKSTDMKNASAKIGQQLSSSSRNSVEAIASVEPDGLKDGVFEIDQHLSVGANETLKDKLKLCTGEPETLPETFKSEIPKSDQQISPGATDTLTEEILSASEKYEEFSDGKPKMLKDEVGAGLKSNQDSSAETVVGLEYKLMECEAVGELVECEAVPIVVAFPDKSLKKDTLSSSKSDQQSLVEPLESFKKISLTTAISATQLLTAPMDILNDELVVRRTVDEGFVAINKSQEEVVPTKSDQRVSSLEILDGAAIVGRASEHFIQVEAIRKSKEQLELSKKSDKKMYDKDVEQASTHNNDLTPDQLPRKEIINKNVRDQEMDATRLSKELQAGHLQSDEKLSVESVEPVDGATHTPEVEATKLTEVLVTRIKSDEQLNDTIPRIKRQELEVYARELNEEVIARLEIDQKLKEEKSIRRESHEQVNASTEISQSQHLFDEKEIKGQSGRISKYIQRLAPRSAEVGQFNEVKKGASDHHLATNAKGNEEAISSVKSAQPLKPRSVELINKEATDDSAREDPSSALKSHRRLAPRSVEVRQFNEIKKGSSDHHTKANQEAISSVKSADGVKNDQKIGQQLSSSSRNSKEAVAKTSSDQKISVTTAQKMEGVENVKSDQKFDEFTDQEIAGVVSSVEEILESLHESDSNVHIEKLPSGKSSHDDMAESSIGLIIDQLLKDVKENAKPSDQQVGALGNSKNAIVKSQSNPDEVEDDEIVGVISSVHKILEESDLNVDIEKLLFDEQLDDEHIGGPNEQQFGASSKSKDEKIAPMESYQQFPAVDKLARCAVTRRASDKSAASDVISKLKAKSVTTVKSDQQLLAASVEILKDEANDNRGGSYPTLVAKRKSKENASMKSDQTLQITSTDNVLERREAISQEFLIRPIEELQNKAIDKPTNEYLVLSEDVLKVNEMKKVASAQHLSPNERTKQELGVVKSVQQLIATYVEMFEDEIINKRAYDDPSTETDVATLTIDPNLRIETIPEQVSDNSSPLTIIRKSKEIESDEEFPMMSMEMLTFKVIARRATEQTMEKSKSDQQMRRKNVVKPTRSEPPIIQPTIDENLKVESAARQTSDQRVRMEQQNSKGEAITRHASTSEKEFFRQISTEQSAGEAKGSNGGIVSSLETDQNMEIAAIAKRTSYNSLSSATIVKSEDVKSDQQLPVSTVEILQDQISHPTTVLSIAGVKSDQQAIAMRTSDNSLSSATIVKSEDVKSDQQLPVSTGEILQDQISHPTTVLSIAAVKSDQQNDVRPTNTPESVIYNPLTFSTIGTSKEIECVKSDEQLPFTSTDILKDETSCNSSTSLTMDKSKEIATIKSDQQAPVNKTKNEADARASVYSLPSVANKKSEEETVTDDQKILSIAGEISGSNAIVKVTSEHVVDVNSMTKSNIEKIASQGSGRQLSSLSLHLENQAISKTEANRQSGIMSSEKSKHEAVTNVKSVQNYDDFKSYALNEVISSVEEMIEEQILIAEMPTPESTGSRSRSDITAVGSEQVSTERSRIKTVDSCIWRELLHNDELIDRLCEKVLNKLRAGKFCGSNCGSPCGGLNPSFDANKLESKDKSQNFE